MTHLLAQFRQLQAQFKNLESQFSELQDSLARERQTSASLIARIKVLENEIASMKNAIEKDILEDTSFGGDLRGIPTVKIPIEGNALISDFDQTPQLDEMALTISTLGVALIRAQKEIERLTRHNLTLIDTGSRFEDGWSSLDEQASEKEQVLKQTFQPYEAHLQESQMFLPTPNCALESAEAQNCSFRYTNAALEDSNHSLSSECASPHRRLQEKEELKQMGKDSSKQLQDLEGRVEGSNPEIRFLNNKGSADREASVDAGRSAADSADEYGCCSALKENDPHIKKLIASLSEANTREAALKDRLRSLEDRIDFVWPEMKKEANRSDADKRHLEQVTLWDHKEQQYKDTIQTLETERLFLIRLGWIFLLYSLVHLLEALLPCSSKIHHIPVLLTISVAVSLFSTPSYRAT